MYNVQLDPLCVALFHRALSLSIRLTKTTAARNEVALSYHKVRGLYFLLFLLYIFMHIRLHVLSKGFFVTTSYEANTM